jgi:co-chaperonin GroES (HSP10)
VKELTVLFDRVAVELDPRDDHRGGFIIPDAYKKTSLTGTVRAVGEKARDVLVGDKVYIPATSGTKFLTNGVEVVIVREGQLLGKAEA